MNNRVGNRNTQRPVWAALKTGVFGTLLLPAVGWSNAGPPTRGAPAFLAEPVGIRDVEIVREHLNIDLRGFANGGPAQVEAVYQLHNRGPEQMLDLVFVTGAGAVLGFQVRLGDELHKIEPFDLVYVAPGAEEKLARFDASKLKAPPAGSPPSIRRPVFFRISR